MKTTLRKNHSITTQRMLIFSLTLVSLTLSTVYAAVLEKIDPMLFARIEAGENMPVIVELKSSDALVKKGALERERDIIKSVDKFLNTLPSLKQSLSRRYSNLPLIALSQVNKHYLDRLLANDQVSAIYEDIELVMHTMESSPLIGADKVQAQGIGGANTTVVVLDSGIDYTRTEFGACTSPGVPASCRVPVAFDQAPNDSQLDSNGHGTNVSAIVATIASQTAVIGIDVFNGTSASSSDVIAGIDWAISNKDLYNIRAINMSIGTGTKKTSTCDNRTNPFQTAINTAHSDGIAVVASAGNSAFTDGIEIPACSANTVSVGATYDKTSNGWNWSICTDAPATVDTVTCFSNSAAFLSVLAPGAIITAGGYEMGGTSQAAPHVAAAIAILAGVYTNETPTDWLGRLQNTGVLITDSRNGITKPRIDIYAAMGISANIDNNEEIPFLPSWAFFILTGVIIRGLVRANDN